MEPVEKIVIEDEGAGRALNEIARVAIIRDEAKAIIERGNVTAMDIEVHDTMLRSAGLEAYSVKTLYQGMESITSNKERLQASCEGLSDLISTAVKGIKKLFGAGKPVKKLSMTSLFQKTKNQIGNTYGKLSWYPKVGMGEGVVLFPTAKGLVDPKGKPLANLNGSIVLANNKAMEYSKIITDDIIQYDKSLHEALGDTNNMIQPETTAEQAKTYLTAQVAETAIRQYDAPPEDKKYNAGINISLAQATSETNPIYITPVGDVELPSLDAEGCVKLAMILIDVLDNMTPDFDKDIVDVGVGYEPGQITSSDVGERIYKLIGVSDLEVIFKGDDWTSLNNSNFGLFSRYAFCHQLFDAIEDYILACVNKARAINQ